MDDFNYKLGAIAREIESSPLKAVNDIPPSNIPRAAQLMGQAMVKSCEDAAQEVEALGQAVMDAAQQAVASTDALAKLIRERSEAMRINIESFVTSLRDTASELETRREKINDFTASMHRDYRENEDMDAERKRA